jgi:hypothetical protein
MTKTHRRKTEPDDYLSKNQGHAIKYRKRLQEDIETTEELKDFIKEEDCREDHSTIPRGIL